MQILSQFGKLAKRLMKVVRVQKEAAHQKTCVRERKKET